MWYDREKKKCNKGRKIDWWNPTKILAIAIVFIICMNYCGSAFGQSTAPSHPDIDSVHHSWLFTECNNNGVHCATTGSNTPFLFVRFKGLPKSYQVEYSMVTPSGTYVGQQLQPPSVMIGSGGAIYNNNKWTVVTQPGIVTKTEDDPCQIGIQNIPNVGMTGAIFTCILTPPYIIEWSLSWWDHKAYQNHPNYDPTVRKLVWNEYYPYCFGLDNERDSTYIAVPPVVLTDGETILDSIYTTNWLGQYDNEVLIEIVKRDGTLVKRITYLK